MRNDRVPAPLANRVPLRVEALALAFAAALGWLLLLGPLSMIGAGGFSLPGDAFELTLRSLATATVSTAIAMSTALAASRLLANRHLPFRFAAGLDLPLALPPVVVGLCWLILFRGPLQWADDRLSVVADWPGVLLAQIGTGTALACRLVQAVVSNASRGPERALSTMGEPPTRAWRLATLRGTAGSLAATALVVWAQTFGAFGPVLVLAGATAGRTEVLPTAIYLHVSAGELAEAATLSLLMIVVAVAGTAAARWLVRRTGDAPSSTS